jgi:thioester reductase-like protein
VLMRNQLADMTGLALPATIAFEHPNLRALSEYIMEKIRETGLEVISDPVEVAPLVKRTDDTEAKNGYLDPDLQFQNASNISSTPEAIFVTGATGFVGAFLLNEMLKSNLTVFCLVRAENNEQATERLKETLDAYGLWSSNYADLINPVVGDLAQPFFGLSEDEFNHLADRVDAICHSGAVVDWMLPLENYLGPNVLGTHEMLRLASRGRGKAVHYVSTYATLPKYLGYKILPENTMDYGYLMSKWMGEQMVAAAQWRGAAASVYRLPFVGACSNTGHFRLDRGDFLHNLIAGCIDMGCFPSLDGDLRGLLPVDYLAKAISQTMTSNLDRIGKNYDFINPKAPSFNGFIELIRNTGCSVDTVCFEVWQTKALEYAKEHPKSSLARISVLVDSLMKNELELMLEGYPVGRDVFGGETCPCPPVNEKSVRPYVDRITAALCSPDKKIDEVRPLVGQPM